MIKHTPLTKQACGEGSGNVFAFTSLLSLCLQAPCAPPHRQLPSQMTRTGPTQARPPRCLPRGPAPPTPTTPRTPSSGYATRPGAAPPGPTSSTRAAGRWRTIGPTPANSQRCVEGSGSGQQKRRRGSRTYQALGGPSECAAPPLTQT